VANPAAALGEAIGKLIQDEVGRIISPVCERFDCYYDSGGLRSGKRDGTRLELTNTSGNKYNLDGVVENAKGEPIVLVESKYLRYTKHNRDKASWTCVAHSNVRKSYPTIRKSIAVLSGNWTASSQALMRSFGIELYEVPFLRACAVLRQWGVEFQWEEKDTKTPAAALEAFQRLSAEQRVEIGGQLLSPIAPAIASDIESTLKLEAEDIAQQIASVELLLKTRGEEMITRVFPDCRSAVTFLLSLQEEPRDLRGRL